jgi:hypothetical protein
VLELLQIDVRLRMFFREDVESRPVEDQDFDAKDALDEILRRKITPHANPIATVLAAWCCHPQALFAVKELECWAAWEWALTFATESHTVMHSLCEDIASGRAAALWAALQRPLPRTGTSLHGSKVRSQSRTGSALDEHTPVRGGGAPTGSDIVSEPEAADGCNDVVADEEAMPVLFIAPNGAQTMLTAEEAVLRGEQGTSCTTSKDGMLSFSLHV